MRTRTRTTTLVITTVMSLALATAAWGAPGGGKGKPQPTDDLVDVTMTLVGDEGLTTLDDCDDDSNTGSLSMKRTRNGLESVEDVAPILGLYMDDIAWERKYPEPLSDSGFAGCHGGTVLGSPYAWDGHLWIDIDPDGAVTDLLWHFDYYLDGEVTVNKSGKERYRQTVRENFTLSGHDLTWNTVTETVSGAFTVSHFLIENWKDGEEIGYVPFGPPHELSFTLTFQPA